MSLPRVGQRWTSTAEPELGQGRIEAIQNRNIVIRFPRSGETRIFRVGVAPLERLRYTVGATVHSQDGRSLKVEQVSEVEGLYHYRAGDEVIREDELGESAAASSENLAERLLEGHFDTVEAFELRTTARELREHREGSEVRGLVGARIDLIPHQLQIAWNSCAEARLPRRLLSDEVGLGKTIEAGLIYQRLKATGRVKRTLIIVPESLKHQWMVEMYRRFHTTFTLVDEDYCEELECAKAEKEAVPNPFTQKSDLIVDLDFVLFNPERMKQLLSARFDLVIVDEAHTIDPGEDGDSADYMFLYRLSRQTPGLLLLTATPVQLQLHAHFARLHLLDPARYPKFSLWREEYDNYVEIAGQLGKMIDRVKSSSMPWPEMVASLPGNSKARKLAATVPESEGMTAADGVRFLCDTLGTGRAVIRNTRHAIGGFPERRLHEYPLAQDPEYRERLAAFECPADDREGDVFRLNSSLAWDKEWFEGELRDKLAMLWLRDEKVVWLAGLLKKELRRRKVLVLCSAREVVLALQESLSKMIPREIVVFHEDVPLVARDRAAAWFADPKGADILIASEIGSEGRNFQFSHDLVMYDLPVEPGLLEQRIGRLDRIGQRATVEIHVACVKDTAQQRLFEWYNLGLEAFRRPLMGVEAVHRQFRADLEKHMDLPTLDAETFRTTFAAKVRKVADKLRTEVEEGRDRLLEFNSHDPERAQELVAKVRHEDETHLAEFFVLEALEHFGAEVEKGPADRSWVVHPGEHMRIDEFPGLTEDGLTLTSARSLALDREDIDFLSMDHPLVQGALDLLLGGNEGSTSFAVCRTGIPKGIWSEFHFLLESGALPEWNLQEAVHPRQLRVLIDRSGKAHPKVLEDMLPAHLEDGQASQVERVAAYLNPLWTNIEASARTEAERIVAPWLQEMAEKSDRMLETELRRLRVLLASGYPGVENRIEQLEKRRGEVAEAIRKPMLRLDSLRIILSH